MAFLRDFWELAAAGAQKLVGANDVGEEHALVQYMARRKSVAEPPHCTQSVPHHISTQKNDVIQEATAITQGSTKRIHRSQPINC